MSRGIGPLRTGYILLGASILLSGLLIAAFVGVAHVLAISFPEEAYPAMALFSMVVGLGTVFASHALWYDWFG